MRPFTVEGQEAMLDALPVPIRLDIAILLTALAWGIGLYVADRKVYVFASLAIGAFVCLLGYSVESLGAPAGWSSRRRSRWTSSCCGTS